MDENKLQTLVSDAEYLLKTGSTIKEVVNNLRSKGVDDETISHIIKYVENKKKNDESRIIIDDPFKLERKKSKSSRMLNSGGMMLLYLIIFFTPGILLLTGDMEFLLSDSNSGRGKVRLLKSIIRALYSIQGEPLGYFIAIILIGLGFYFIYKEAKKFNEVIST
ncbi:hypothetical protein [Marinigracilibium pacificum]|uniref:Uncharacterized protein n=1 Tax=Marinigracilibium pacificum TaxID=2729599 RepID=A0A848J635_9BACT|nr:hypothetical protein [Marinigracilibium pacificum]NMM48592.1 hypothetical protein [Marinigracilibium pacificum]